MKPAFDPSLPFEAAAKPAFDPNAPFEAASEGPSGLESLARGAGQGATFKFGDELTGTAQALWENLKGSDTPFAEAYRKHRDEARLANEAAKNANPTEYGVGEFGGSVLPNAALAIGTGGTSIPEQIALGAAGGAASALGGADELNADAGQQVLEQGLLGGVAGGGGAVGGQLLGKGLNAATEAIAPKAAEALERLGISQGRRAIGGGLKSELDDSAVRRALEEGHVGYGDTVGDIAKKLGAATEQAGATKASIVAKLEEMGVPGADAHSIAERWVAEGAALKRTTLGSSAPGAYERSAAELLDKADAAGKVRLSDLEQIKTSAQQNVDYGPFANTDARNSNSAWRDMASNLREAGEDSITAHAAANPDNAALQETAQSFVPAKQRYGDLVEASAAAEKGALRAADRSTVGPTAKLAGLASVATGHPMGLLAAGGKHLFDTRGASTVARGAWNLAKSLGKVGQVALTNPERLGAYGGVLASAAQRGADALNSAIFVLGNSDPHFQKMAAELDAGGTDNESAP